MNQIGVVVHVEVNIGGYVSNDKYIGNLTEEDIRDAERKYPLADVPMLTIVVPMLILLVFMFVVGVFIL